MIRKLKKITPKDRSAFFRKDWQGKNQPYIEMELVCIALSDDDGSRPCAINSGELQQMIGVLNSAYAPSRIRFKIRSFNWRSTLINSIDDLANVRNPDAKSIIDRICRENKISRSSFIGLFRYGANPMRPTGQGLGGYPFRCILLTALSTTNAGPPMLAHEVGHALGLGHTFDKLRTYGEAVAMLRENQGSTKCFDGDGLEDTPNDPGIEFNASNGYPNGLSNDLIYIDGIKLQVPLNNLMSYMCYSGRGHLSEKQMQIARWHALAITTINKPEGDIFEFQNMINSAKGNINWQVQDFSMQEIGNFSNNKIAFSKIRYGQFSIFYLNIKTEGTYDICFFAAKAPDYGCIDISLNGKVIMSSLDLNAPLIMSTGKISLGTYGLKAGFVELKIELSKGEFKQERNCIGIDAISLIRSPDPKS